LAVLSASVGIVVADSDNQVSLVEAVAAIGLLALLGGVVVCLTIWLSDDEPTTAR
jgi:hypothetical protein